jgi:hypothetical protein
VFHDSTICNNANFQARALLLRDPDTSQQNKHLVATDTMDELSDATFERLSLDESLRRTFSVYRRGFGIFTLIAVLLSAIMAALWAILLPILLALLNVDGKDFADPDYLVDHMKQFYLLLGANWVLSVLLGAVAQGMMIKAVADVYLEQAPAFKDCFKIGLKKAGVILLASLLVLVPITFGFLFFLVPGMYLAVQWFVVGPAIVIENKGVVGSMKRSWELVSGSWCYVFCTFLIVTLSSGVFQWIWSALVVGGTDAGHTLFSAVGYVLTLIPGIVVIPITGIVRTVMYFNLRVEKEGLNAHVLSRDLGGPAAYTTLMGDEETGN